MPPIFEIIPEFQAYLPSLIALAVLCLIATIQSFLSAPFAFVREEQVPGMPLRHDHSKLSFRVLRTYSNSVENLPAFGFAVLLPLLAGVPPVLCNWLVGVHLVARLAFWGIYYAGVGKTAGGPRTMAYVLGLLTNIALVVAVIWALVAA